jgi:hypothetical protein
MALLIGDRQGGGSVSLEFSEIVVVWFHDSLFIINVETR